MPYPKKDWITINVVCKNSQLTHNFVVKASCCYDLENAPADWQHLSTEQMIDHLRQMLEVNAIVRSADPIVVLIIDEMTQLQNFSDALLHTFHETLSAHMHFGHSIRKRMEQKIQLCGFQSFGEWQPNVFDQKGVGSEGRENWLVVACKHPMSHSLEISNYQVIEEELSDETGWDSLYQRHWAYGSVDVLIVDPSIHKDYCEKLIVRLETYTMLDESHWTILDMEMGNEE